MTKLSVNINKIATLRNARGGNVPDLLKVATDIQNFGAHGITIHPRPDERHIRYKDARDLKKVVFKEYNIEVGVISIGDNWSRYYVYNQIRELSLDFEFVNAIHPSIVIGNNVTLGKGIVAMAGCIFNPKSFIGNFTFFATGAQVEHDNYIDDFSSISAGSITGGYVKLGKYSAVTLGVTIMDRVEIGENTVIGSGSLVTKSFPSDVLAYGNPAKIIRNRTKGEKFLK